MAWDLARAPDPSLAGQSIDSLIPGQPRRPVLRSRTIHGILPSQRRGEVEGKGKGKGKGKSVDLDGLGTPDVNCSSIYGWTLVHTAAMGGYLDVLEYLIDAGADIGPCDMNGETPLHAAIKNGQFDAAELLLEKGAYADAEDVEGKTPLDWASDAEVHELLEAASDDP